jgi:DNA-binding MarR family transcriptional regulator
VNHGAGGFVQQDFGRKSIAVRALTEETSEEQSRLETSHDANSRMKELSESAGSVKLEIGADDFATLKRILESLGNGQVSFDDLPAGEAEKAAAQHVFQSRRDRARLFPASIFSEPAWDMLLALYIVDEITAAADLARWIDTPLTTAWRWIQVLEDHKLIVRKSRTADRRAHTIRLTDRARTRMQSLFSEVVQKWP